MNTTNDKIRYTAFKLFLERGYEATNIRDICSRVDIKAASMYFYYKSKQELFFSIYDDIWSEELECMRNIPELAEKTAPDTKLYHLFKNTIEYNIRDMIKFKFLLRYHLFPPEEIAVVIVEKYKYWTNQENELIQVIIKQCMDNKLLYDNRSLKEYLREYRKFVNLHVTDMILSNIRLSGSELDHLWNKFWNCTMLNG
ncbi:MAG: transcriptional regulator, TetR family [Herbinix sp.]|jgi:AcrR family transcriptional regulator|nr:transcriptional regulator, TetR family [Herbinix sp.]